ATVVTPVSMSRAALFPVHAGTLDRRATVVTLVPMFASRALPCSRRHDLDGRAVLVSMFGGLTPCCLRAPSPRHSYRLWGVRGVAALDEPGHGGAEGVRGGRLGETELAHRLRRTEVHALPSHAHGVEGHCGRLARHARRALHAAGGEP